MECDSLIQTICLEGRVVPLDEWGLLQVTGEDSENFLQGQTTNDVKNLKPGTSQLSALIDVKGHVHSFFYLLNDRKNYLLLVPKELLPQTVSRIEKYIITEDVTVRNIADDGLFLYMGPQYHHLRTKCLNCFDLFIFSLPALFLWNKEDIRVVKSLNCKALAQNQLEALRFFSDFPNWHKDVDEHSRINDTVLENRAISYSKGCFLGQEIASKIHNNKGARHTTVILEIMEDKTPHTQNFSQQPFQIHGKKAGMITDFLSWEGSHFFRAQLHRSFLIYSETYTIQLSPSITTIVTVRPLPLYGKLGLSDFSERIYYRALQLFSQKDSNDETVIRLLNNSIELNPRFPDAYESLGVIHGRRNEYERAIEYMDKLLEADPDSVMAHTNKSLYLMKMGRFEEAEQEKAEAVATTFRLEQKKAKFKEDEEKKRAQDDEEKKKKMSMFRQVLDIDPDDPLANFSLGRLYNDAGSYNLAEKHLRKVIEKDDTYSAAYLELGIALNGLNRIEETKEIYKKGLPIASRKGEQMIANKIEANLAKIK
jgi:folate-binding protein YgfZ